MIVLNSLDAATSAKPQNSSSNAASAPADPQASPLAAAGKSSSPQQLDPIDFLNKHYTSEAVLVAHLPLLRDAVAQRMEHRNDSISSALQRQSETAEATRRHVQDAKASVVALAQRIHQVQEKASQSESAVLEITRDMKRLDCAKRHLQRTITTLKQLHMLVNAVEQLRIASAAATPKKTMATTSRSSSFPDFRTAASLVDVIRLLLGHFESYTAKVEPMRLLSNKVSDLQQELLQELVRGFRIVAFGPDKTKLMEEGGKTGHAATTKANQTIKQSDKMCEKEDDYYITDDSDSHHLEETAGVVSAKPPTPPVAIMPPDVLRGGVLLIDALGDQVRERFIHDFCQDQLGDYLHEFEPPSTEPPTVTANPNDPPKPEKRISSFKVQLTPEKPSALLSAPSQPPKGEQAKLDHLERRFVWFRQLMQRVDTQCFPKVFPANWNLQASLARHFLTLVCICFYWLFGWLFGLSNCWETHGLISSFSDNSPLLVDCCGGKKNGRQETTFLHCWMDRDEMPTPVTQPSFSKLCKRQSSLKKRLPPGCSENVGPSLTAKIARPNLPKCRRLTTPSTSRSSPWLESRRQPLRIIWIPIFGWKSKVWMNS